MLYLHPLTSAAGTINPEKVKTDAKATPSVQDTLSVQTSRTRSVAPLQVARTFVYTNVRGLHARPAALLVKQLAGFKCSIIVKCNGETANAKSILGLLCLAVGCQSKVTFTATGPDAPEAMAAIDHLFERQFDEAY
jgi:phosphotransferase system HPr (HPr) family protein